MKREPAKVPTLQFLGRDENTERLYALEERAQSAVKAAATELGKALGNDESQFWTESLPCELLGILDGFDSRSSAAAATGYLINLSLHNPDVFAHYWAILEAGVAKPQTT